MMLKTQVNASSFWASSYVVETEVNEVLAGFSRADRHRIDLVEGQLANCGATPIAGVDDRTAATEKYELMMRSWIGIRAGSAGFVAEHD